MEICTLLPPQQGLASYMYVTYTVHWNITHPVLLLKTIQCNRLVPVPSVQLASEVSLPVELNLPPVYIISFLAKPAH